MHFSKYKFCHYVWKSARNEIRFILVSSRLDSLDLNERCSNLPYCSNPQIEHCDIVCFIWFVKIMILIPVLSYLSLCISKACLLTIAWFRPLQFNFQ